MRKTGDERKESRVAPGAVSNSFGFALYGFVGWVVVPVLISCGYLALRSVLGFGPEARLPTDFLGAAVGLATIGLISTCPLWIAVGAAVGASLGKAAPDPVLYKRLRLLVLLGPALFFGGLGFLAYLVDGLGRSLPA